jgi:hypothetical protein
MGDNSTCEVLVSNVKLASENALKVVANERLEGKRREVCYLSSRSYLASFNGFSLRKMPIIEAMELVDASQGIIWGSSWNRACYWLNEQATELSRAASVTAGETMRLSLKSAAFVAEWLHKE